MIDHLILCVFIVSGLLAWKAKLFNSELVISTKHQKMGFIKHALIGIALYEAVKYILNKKDSGLEPAHGTQGASAVNQQLRREDVDVIAGARQTDQLNRMKENAASSDELVGGTDPEAPLIGKASDEDDPWKNSLASDELRAPDS